MLTEYVNGPCRENQELLYYGTNDQEKINDPECKALKFDERNCEIILGIIKRRITDLDSLYVDLQGKSVTFLLAFIENSYKPGVDLICNRLDPSVIFKIMIDLLKRLYVKTVWNSQDSVNQLEDDLRASGKLKMKHSNSVHYKKKEFGGKLDDTVPLETGEKGFDETGFSGTKSPQQTVKSQREHSIQAPKDGRLSMKNITKKSFTKSGFHFGNVLKKKQDAQLSVEECLLESIEDYNVYNHSNADIKRYFDQDFVIESNNLIKEHYLQCDEFEQHPVMELVIQIYAFIKALECNHKFRGYIKKKTEDLKRHYWMLPSVAALCTNEELAILKKRPVVEIPEEIKIFCFIQDTCQSVEIINNNGECTKAYYPMLPKVYYLTSKSVNSFRAECRIEQSTTKLMDLMSYVEQFDIEMEINNILNDKYNTISKILSGDAFAMYKQGLWILGFFINLLVIGFYEIINGELTIGDANIAFVVYVLSMVKLFLCFIIINLWFAFRYNAIRKIEREKFMIKDPGVDPDTG